MRLTIEWWVENFAVMQYAQYRGELKLWEMRLRGRKTLNCPCPLLGEKSLWLFWLAGDIWVCLWVRRGWDGWMASLTRWTWVWVNSGSWWWTGRRGVLRFMGSRRAGHDWATELNWTEAVSCLEVVCCVCDGHMLHTWIMPFSCLNQDYDVQFVTYCWQTRWSS